MSNIKDIQDYLHLYIGAECLWEHIEGNFGGREIIDGHMIESHKATKNAIIRPLLRPLSDMKEEDVKEWSDVNITHTPYCVELDSKDPDGEFTEVYPDGSILSKSKDDGDIRPIDGGLLFRLLLSKHFDLFGLIPAGLAIDKTQQP